MTVVLRGRTGAVADGGSSPPSVDFSWLADLGADLGVEGLREVCGRFLADAGHRIGLIERALGTGDATWAADEAHQLKSASGFLGAFALSALAAEVIDLAGSGDLAGARNRAGRLAGEKLRVGRNLDRAVARLAGTPDAQFRPPARRSHRRPPA